MDSRQSTAQRNPLIDPRTGDILRIRHWSEKQWFRDYEVVRVDEAVCFLGRSDRGQAIPMAYCAVSNWPRLMENAEVVSVAD